MEGSKDAIADALRRMAGTPPAGAKLAVERLRRKGTPGLWSEETSIEHGGKQRYATIRGFVDAGGAPIGQWEATADRDAVQAVAAALVGAKVWELASAPVSPGAELNRWRVATDQGEHTITVPGNSTLLMKLSQVDVQFRRIANALIASRKGAALKCLLDLKAPAQGPAMAQIGLVNEGDQDCLVMNPLAGLPDPQSFLRIEAAAPPPPQQPGVTGPGLRYVPLPLPEHGKLPDPWGAESFVLKAGERVVLPLRVTIPLLAHKGHYIRAVYSCYRVPATPQKLPVVRGCTFSTEQRLEP